ncbi:spidroin-2-like [Arapaima gigas]
MGGGGSFLGIVRGNHARPSLRTPPDLMCDSVSVRPPGRPTVSSSTGTSPSLSYGATFIPGSGAPGLYIRHPTVHIQNQAATQDNQRAPIQSRPNIIQEVVTPTNILQLVVTPTNIQLLVVTQINIQLLVVTQINIQLLVVTQINIQLLVVTQINIQLLVVTQINIQLLVVTQINIQLLVVTQINIQLLVVTQTNIQLLVVTQINIQLLVVTQINIQLLDDIPTSIQGEEASVLEGTRNSIHQLDISQGGVRLQSKGYSPSIKSKSFGKKAALAAGLGGVGGMVIGKKMGRSKFRFHNPVEERMYNDYMYHRHRAHAVGDHTLYDPNPLNPKWTDPSQMDPWRNESNNNRAYVPPGQSFKNFMKSCMKRTDLLKGQHDDITWQATDGVTSQGINPKVTSKQGPQEELLNKSLGNEKLKTVGAGNGSINVTSSQGETVDILVWDNSKAPAADPQEDDNDTVSILEIGYPELIEQLMVQRCQEFFIVYAAQHQQNLTTEREDILNGNAMQQCPFCRGLLLLFTSALMIFSTRVLLH